jgi:CII-binding regulator of phage lambda lysogenization HflD
MPHNPIKNISDFDEVANAGSTPQIKVPSNLEELGERLVSMEKMFNTLMEHVLAIGEKVNDVGYQTQVLNQSMAQIQLDINATMREFRVFKARMAAAAQTKP